MKKKPAAGADFFGQSKILRKKKTLRNFKKKLKEKPAAGEEIFSHSKISRKISYYLKWDRGDP